MGLLPGLEEGAEVYDRYSLTPTIRNLYYNLNQFVNELWLCYFRKIALEKIIDILIDIIWEFIFRQLTVSAKSHISLLLHLQYFLIFTSQDRYFALEVVHVGGSAGVLWGTVGFSAH